ncbi:MAG: hypothetical protein ACPGSD_14190 [Flavobacteriales bacterium]
MSVHNQYGLFFRIKLISFRNEIPKKNAICSQSIETSLTYEMANFINDYDNFIYRDDLHGIIEEIQEILDGTWDGIEEEDDNLKISPSGFESIRLDLVDGNAYFISFDGTELGIPLTDLKAIFEEWEEFVANIE